MDLTLLSSFVSGSLCSACSTMTTCMNPLAMCQGYTYGFMNEIEGFMKDDMFLKKMIIRKYEGLKDLSNSLKEVC